MSEVKIASDANELAETAAKFIVGSAGQAIEAHGDFSIALSGGSTPHALYKLLAGQPYRDQIEWSKVQVFWGDERCVPPDHVDSCYLMAKETLLDHVPVPTANIHRMKGEANPPDAAAEYEQILRQFFKKDGDARFDLILLGMGDDGHTASLFPGTEALKESERWVVPNYVEVKHMWRLTLTASAINQALNVAFLVSGKDKAERLKQVLQGPFKPDMLPSQLIKPAAGNLTWLVDRAAAALL